MNSVPCIDTSSQGIMSFFPNGSSSHSHGASDQKGSLTLSVVVYEYYHNCKLETVSRNGNCWIDTREICNTFIAYLREYLYISHYLQDILLHFEQERSNSVRPWRKPWDRRSWISPSWKYNYPDVIVCRYRERWIENAEDRNQSLGKPCFL